MDTYIREIYRGNLSAFERPYTAKSKANRVYDRVVSLECRLKQALKPEHHGMLQEYADAFMEYLDACSEDDYIEGYRFGVQAMFAAWPRLENT